MRHALFVSLLLYSTKQQEGAVLPNPIDLRLSVFIRSTNDRSDPFSWKCGSNYESCNKKDLVWHFYLRIHRIWWTHVLPLSFEVLAVPHQLAINLMSHLLCHHLSLTGIVVELIQYGVEGQTWCEPAQQTHIKHQACTQRASFLGWFQMCTVIGSLTGTSAGNTFVHHSEYKCICW